MKFRELFEAKQTSLEKKAVRAMEDMFPKYKGKVFINGDDTITTFPNVATQEFKNFIVWYIEEKVDIGGRAKREKVDALTIEIEPK